MSFLDRLMFAPGPSQSIPSKLVTIRLVEHELETAIGPQASDLAYMLDLVKQDQAYLTPRDTEFS